MAVSSVALVLTCLTAANAAAGGDWRVRAQLPYPSAQHMTASVAGPTQRTLFVFGGRSSSASPMVRASLRYSATANRWTKAAPMRYARGIGQAVTVKGFIYVLGGCRELGTGLDRAEAYNPVTDSWRTLPNMPESLHDFGAIAWRDSIIFLLGGGNWAQRSPPRARVLIFDPAQTRWDTATSLPMPLGAMAAAGSGDTILIAAGWTADGPANALWQGLVNPQDPRGIIWQYLDTIPGPRRFRPVAAAANGLLYLIGGVGPDGTTLSDAWTYDRMTGAWTALEPAPRPVTDIQGLPLLGSRLYLPAGLSGPEPYSTSHICLEITRFERDAGVDSVISPAGRLQPLRSHPVRTTVTNLGLGPTIVEAAASIADSISGQLLFESDVSLFLDSGETRVVDFGDFFPPVNAWFLLLVTVRGLFDQNPDNDTIWQHCHTAPGSTPDGHGYAYRSTQEPDDLIFQWLDPTGGTPVTDWRPNPDDGSSLRELPFPFPFYGDTIRQLYLCTDGFLQTTNLPTGANRALPFFTFPNIIAPFWDDLTLSRSGKVIEQLYSASAVYTWIEVPRYGAPHESLTFQLALHASGRIAFNYLRMKGLRTSSTVGIQGKSGTWNQYLQYVCDGIPENHVPADSVSILFSSPLVGIAEPRSPLHHPQLLLHLPTISAGQPVLIQVAYLLPSSDFCLSLQVFDPSGRLIRNLASGAQPSATQSFTWDLKDQSGQRQSPGTYFILARAGSVSVTRKLVLIR